MRQQERLPPSNLAMDSEAALELARDFLGKRYANSITLTETNLDPGSVYGFDPEGWVVFAIFSESDPRIGGTECVAVHRESGVVRSIGMIGE